MLGQTLKRAKANGQMYEGRRKQTVVINDSFSLKAADITRDQSSHARALRRVRRKIRTGFAAQSGPGTETCPHLEPLGRL